MSNLNPERIAAVANEAARAGFTGVVRVDAGDTMLHASAHGLADRAHRVANTLSTRFAGASALKGCTALTVMSLIEAGLLALDTSVTSILPTCNSFIDREVTVQHLLSHRSGIGEYYDEIDPSRPVDAEAIANGIPAQCAIEHPAAILTLMKDTPARSRPGAEFRYNNAGFVVLALLAETVTGTPFVDLVERDVFTPAGMSSSAVLTYDELDGDVAIGYLKRDGLKTNIHAVPNRGIGDGGIFTSVHDMVLFWRALYSGALVGTELVALMTTPHGRTPGGTPYGLGFWLDPVTDAINLEGYDHGISFRSVHRPSDAVTLTVASNWTDGAWPLADGLELLVGTCLGDHAYRFRDFHDAPAGDQWG